MISDFYYYLNEEDCLEIRNHLIALTKMAASVKFMPSLSDTDEYDNCIRIILPVNDFHSIVQESSHATKTMNLLFRYLIERNAINLYNTIFLSDIIKVFFDRDATHVVNNTTLLVANVVFEGYIEGVTNNVEYNMYLDEMLWNSQ